MSEASAATVLQQIVGDEIMAEICRELGGQRVYIPKAVPRQRPEPLLVLTAFEEVLGTAPSITDAYQMVADTFHMSSRTVMRVVNS